MTRLAAFLLGILLARAAVAGAAAESHEIAALTRLYGPPAERTREPIIPCPPDPQRPRKVEEANSPTTMLVFGVDRDREVLVYRHEGKIASVEFFLTERGKEVSDRTVGWSKTEVEDVLKVIRWDTLLGPWIGCDAGVQVRFMRGTRSLYRERGEVNVAHARVFSDAITDVCGESLFRRASVYPLEIREGVLEEIVPPPPPPPEGPGVLMMRPYVPFRCRPWGWLRISGTSIPWYGNPPAAVGERVRYALYVSGRAIIPWPPSRMTRIDHKPARSSRRQ